MKVLLHGGDTQYLCLDGKGYDNITPEQRKALKEYFLSKEPITVTIGGGEDSDGVYEWIKKTAVNGCIIKDETGMYYLSNGEMFDGYFFLEVPDGKAWTIVRRYEEYPKVIYNAEGLAILEPGEDGEMVISKIYLESGELPV